MSDRALPPPPPDGDALGPALSHDDERALDALIEADWNLDAVPETLRERARAVRALLTRLETVQHAASSEALVAATLARIDAAESAEPGDLPALCPADDDALEALVSSGYDPRRVTGGMRERATRHLALLDLLNSGATDQSMSFARESLVQRTLARIDSTPALALGADTIPISRGRRGPRLADLISVAAILLLGGAVAWPVTTTMRDSARQTACLGNLAGLGGAFASYATDHQDRLPMASDSPVGTPWWHVGDPARSNSANMFVLKRTQYVPGEQMACAGNPWARCELPSGALDWPTLQNVSYSYQNMFARQRPTFTLNPDVVVAVDRSPVVLRAVRGEWIDPFENSPNHKGRGQVMLRLDGAAAWTTSPVRTDTGDNVWLPRDLEEAIRAFQAAHGKREAAPLKGVESPAAGDDVFVGP